MIKDIDKGLTLKRFKRKSKETPFRNSGSKDSTKFHIEFKNIEQKMAWAALEQHDVVFLVGPAGTGKSHLAMAYAIHELLQKRKERIVVSRPIVESGEKLGFLPGEVSEKVAPYILSLYDCISNIVGREGIQRDIVNASLEIVPLAYMRGRSELNSQCLITPNGLKPIGEMKVGDYVIGSDGQPTQVIGVYPQGQLPIYEIGFSDHTKSVCSGDHLWTTMTLGEKRYNKGYTVKSTFEIMEIGIKNKYNQKIHRVPLVTAPVQFEPKPLSIDPYLLGVLLGDGLMSKGLGICTGDIEIVDECIARLPSGHKMVYVGKFDYRIRATRGHNNLKSSLEMLNLWGCKSHSKFIPDCYKFNSTECRLAVLQGLLDTDGWICKHRSGNCRIQYCSTSKRLADDVMFLVRSLGGLAYCRKREFDESDNHNYKGKLIRHVHPVYMVDILIPLNPFKLSRKSNQYVNNQKLTKLISYIKPVGHEECTCIQVAAKDHLYLTNDFIVTHNTFSNAVCVLDEAQNASAMQLKLFLTRLGQNSKMIIDGDPKQSDLPNANAFCDCVARLESISGISTVKFTNNAIVRHPLVSKILEKLGD